jgi:hypothetical protein
MEALGWTKEDARFGALLEARLGALYLGWTGKAYAAEIGGRFLIRPGGVPAIRRYVFHHTAGDHKLRGVDIWRYHVKRLGWSTDGYNVFVNFDGTVEVLIPPSRMSYGAGPKWNGSSAHVALSGNYHTGSELRAGQWVDTAHEPPGAGLNSSYVVFCSLDDAYGFKPWALHRELKATACPGRQYIPHAVRMRGPEYGNAEAGGRVRPVSYP